jgi:hypothetical protein
LDEPPRLRGNAAQDSRSQVSASPAARRGSCALPAAQLPADTAHLFASYTGSTDSAACASAPTALFASHGRRASPPTDRPVRRPGRTATHPVSSSARAAPASRRPGAGPGHARCLPLWRSRTARCPQQSRVDTRLLRRSRPAITRSDGPGGHGSGAPPWSLRRRPRRRAWSSRCGHLRRRRPRRRWSPAAAAQVLAGLG